MELTNRFIARQAILDAQSQCIGYELLYRDRDSERATLVDAGRATMQVLDCAYLFGIENLCGQLKAFIKCPQEVLVSDFINVLQPTRTVLEIVETAVPDPDTLKLCARLRQSGFALALDGFLPGDTSFMFLPLVDVVKVDLHTTTVEFLRLLKEKAALGTRLLAKHVETREEYERARSLGFDLFQGFYFCQPQVMATKELSPSRISNLRLLQATVNEELRFSDIETTIKEDAALCYRLLRFVNTVEFCVYSSVKSIRHALALLGERNIRRWILLTATIAAADDYKRRELLRCALLRAKLGELVAPQAKCSEYEGFLLGLFSLMAVILDSPTIPSQIELPASVSAALAGKEGRLRRLLEVVISYERSEWGQCENLARTLNLSETDLSTAYVQAIAWLSKIPL